MQPVNLIDQIFDVDVYIGPLDYKKMVFTLDKTKYLKLWDFLKHICDTINHNSELVLVTEQEDRMIVDIDAIVKGQTLKIVKIPPDIKRFQEKITEMYQQQQQQMRMMRTPPGQGPPQAVSSTRGGGSVSQQNHIPPIPQQRLPPPQSNSSLQLLPKRRGRPPNPDKQQKHMQGGDAVYQNLLRNQQAANLGNGRQLSGYEQMNNNITTPTGNQQCQQAQSERQISQTPGIEEFYAIKSNEKNAIFQKFKRLSNSRGFDLQIPINNVMNGKEFMNIRCVIPGCPFKIMLCRDAENVMSSGNSNFLKIVELAGAHNHQLRQF
ncbi:UNKNOWN [Stylonychia lemnae]|uniref:Uncharacterized protein n=1 Tax=Stylonychia lemnae TaxID=5949 RepID=A0A078AFD2_STYLE|nr:UNKNOWN [Stylonychia lemnae]|eukprot:CDW80237.1 UNKNOWN [Stylonychia lemnae]